MSERIVIKDQEETIEIGFADVEKYHGQWAIAGAAVAFKVLQAAFAELFPDRPPRREDITIISGHPGPGIRDAFEMVTRVVSRGAYTVDAARPKAGCPSHELSYYSFTVASADGRRAEVVLREGILPPRFSALWDAVLGGTASDDERRELDELKRSLARDLIPRPASELFTVEVTDATARP